MPNKLIIDGAIVDDTWQLVAADATQIPEGAVIIPLALWNEQRQQLSDRDHLGIWLNSDESPQLIADCLDQFAVVAVNFPAFTDGRGFSYARELREQHDYKGEIRAIGSFIRDQLFYLKRCGFNAFSLQGVDLQSALESFGDFSESYQAAVDVAEPLFMRR